MDAAQARALANDWLKDFCLALKNVALYSPQHPRGQEYLERAYESLKRVLGDRRETVLTRSDGRLLLDQVLLDRDRGLSQQLAEDLAARGVDSIVFQAAITPEEHLRLIGCLLTKPERINEKGGFSQLLLAEGVPSVRANSERVVRAPDGGESSSLSETALVRFLAQAARGQGGAAAGEAGMPSVTSVLARDPAAVVRAVAAAARGREGGGPSSPEAMAEAIADTLERLAERALEEHQSDREQILADLGRALMGADPEIHPPLFLEKAGARSIRKHLVAAVENLSAERIAELVAIHFPRAGGDFRTLADLLNRTVAWRDGRSAVLAAAQAKLRAAGMGDQELRDLIDHLLWGEASLARRLELLYNGDFLWTADFARLKEVLVKLFATDQIREAATLIQKYLSGLMADDLEVRRRVAASTRYILQLIEKTRKGQPMLGRITELFFTRLQDEQDADVLLRLAGGLAFLADLRLRTGELGAALDLMRKVEQLVASSVPAIKERGERLAEALARAGSDKIFKKLSEMLLEGGDQASMEAAEILKRGGVRSANYLIERLAEEENRSHRARLVMLLKEMGKGSSVPFVSRLEDPRWFLVRNVVGILGDIGDAGALPQLKKVASHGDPRVRREVVRTFMRLGTPECEDLIIVALADEDRGVQITAVNALATLKGRRAAGVLADVARKAGPFENVASEVRQEAIVGLGRLGSSEAFPILSEILSRKGFLGHAEPVELRIAAARALGGLGSPDALALLKELAQKEPRPQVREAAQEGLQQRAASAAGVSRPR